MKFWQQTYFWKKLEESLALISGITITTAGFEGASSRFFIVVGICGIVAKLIFIWIEDKDNNGVVDIFDKWKKGS